MRVLYFAWVREQVGTGQETVSPPPEVTSVADLLDWLAGRSAGHAAALADRSRLRAAVDGVFAALDAPVAGASEVALFPPVTGG
jgi:molybdopterin synthase sulfur carrier subunit